MNYPDAIDHVEKIRGSRNQEDEILRLYIEKVIDRGDYVLLCNRFSNNDLYEGYDDSLISDYAS